MPVTQVLNSKANVKKTTNQDLPFSPKQPVISSYYATSSLNQTVINLSFSVDQDLTDQFFLFVDGKKLRLGASDDYTFTSVGADNTSTQVTLNYALPIDLNIQAYMLGLKPESEFLMDNRFVQLYAAQGQSFQGFVSDELTMVSTTTTGTPVAGTFYSTIVGRADMMDLSQDLRANMGIDRMAIQQIYAIQTESGPAGEPVFGAVNDIFNKVRFVGGGWTNVNDATGAGVISANTGDYIEVTFYGTGLNLLNSYTVTTSDLRASVDGGAEGANILGLTVSSILSARNVALNNVVQVFDGLALGVHTVKLRVANTTVSRFYGFEVINESGLVNVNPGISYIQGKKYVSGSQSSFAYNSMATGVRGGRSVIYQDGLGSISSAWQAVNASQANLTLADHTNEEVARVYHFREFGASFSDDDFSTLGTVNATVAFSLDDGTTTLGGAIVNVFSNGTVRTTTNGTSYVFITFVGTGLDIVRQDTANGGADTYTVLVDGSSIGTLASAGSTVSRREKIVSGLPYGTHTVRITQTSAATYNIGFMQFIVYQPKKPAIPSGTVELADYNVMATYAASSSAAIGFVSSGVLRKALAARESVLTGTWTISATPNVVDFDTGINTTSTVSTSAWSYTFFGTGFDIRTLTQANAQNATVSVDGSTNLSGFTTAIAQTSSGVTFTAATGAIAGTSAAINRLRIQVSDIPLGVHTVRVVTNNTNNFYVDALDIITPIHSAKSNLSYDQQNTLSVGSQGMADSRALTPTKDIGAQTKNVSQATGIVASPTVTSTIAVPMPDMSIVHTNKTGRIKISYNLSLTNSANNEMYTDIYVDGVFQKRATSNGRTTQYDNRSDILTVSVSPGTHKVDIYWAVSAGTSTLYANQRVLTVEEV